MFFHNTWLSEGRK